MSKEPVRRKKAAMAALDAAEVAAIVSGEHGDPFAVLGVQGSGAALAARAFVDGAAELEAFTLDGTPAGTLPRRHDAGFFEGPLGIRKRQPLKYRARNAGGEWWVADPHSFGPVLGPMDDYYIREGSHLRLFDRMGAHPPATRAPRASTSPSGPERPPRLGGRRLQRLGWPPPHHAPPPRHRHLGDLRPRGPPPASPTSTS